MRLKDPICVAIAVVRHRGGEAARERAAIAGLVIANAFGSKILIAFENHQKRRRGRARPSEGLRWNDATVSLQNRRIAVGGSISEPHCVLRSENISDRSARTGMVASDRMVIESNPR